MYSICKCGDIDFMIFANDFCKRILKDQVNEHWKLQQQLYTIRSFMTRLALVFMWI